MDVIQHIGSYLQTPYGVTFLAVIALASLVVGTVGLKAGSRRKELTFFKDSSWIVRDNINDVDGLTMLFNGQPVKDLTATKIIVWCSGSSDITLRDLAANRALRIRAEGDGTSILDACVVQGGSSINGFSISDWNDREVIFHFDYFGSDDGFAVLLLHTGNACNLQIEGKLVNGEVKEYLPQKVPVLSQISRPRFMRYFFIASVVFSAAIIIYSILLIAGFAPSDYEVMSAESYRLQSGAMMLVMALLMLAIIMFAFRRINRVEIPHRLRN